MHYLLWQQKWNRVAEKIEYLSGWHHILELGKEYFFGHGDIGVPQVTTETVTTEKIFGSYLIKMYWMCILCVYRYIICTEMHIIVTKIVIHLVVCGLNWDKKVENKLLICRGLQFAELTFILSQFKFKELKNIIVLGYFYTYAPCFPCETKISIETSVCFYQIRSAVYMYAVPLTVLNISLVTIPCFDFSPKSILHCVLVWSTSWPGWKDRKYFTPKG